MTRSSGLPHLPRQPVRRVLQYLAVGAIAFAIFGSGRNPGAQVPEEPRPDLGKVLNDPSRSMVVTVGFSSRTSAAFKSAEVVRGPTRSRLGDPGLLEAEVLDNGGAVVDRFHPGHPLRATAHDENGLEYGIHLPSGDGQFVFPFRANLGSLRLKDPERDGAEIVTVPLDPSVRTFCEANSGLEECKANLGIAKFGPSSVAAGQSFTYTLSVGNDGPSRAWDVQVTDTLPEGMTYQSGPQFCTETAPRTLRCDVGALSVGETRQLGLTVAVAPDFLVGRGLVTVTNRASVDSPTLQDQSGGNDSATAATEVIEEADLSVTKQDVVDPVAAGTMVTYRLEVKNERGPSAATSTRVTDTLPEGVGYASASVGGCESAGRTVTCPVGTLLVGQSRELTVTGRVDSNLVYAQAGGGQTTVTNEATVENAAGNDPTPGNNTTTETTTVFEEADVALAKSDVADPVAAGTEVGYVLRVTNGLGPSTASQVTVTDTLPEGVTFLSSTGSCAPVAGTRDVVCGVEAVPVGGTAEVTVTGLVDADLVRSRGGFGSVTVTNQATVANAGGPDPHGFDNTDTEDTTVREEADLSVVKSDAPDPAAAGTEVVYTLRVANAGPSTASRVRLVDALPGDAVHRSDTGKCQPGDDGSLVCEVGAMSVGQTREVTVTALLGEDVVCSAGGPVTLENAVTVQNPGATDPDEQDNRRSEPTAVVDNRIAGEASGQRLRFSGILGLLSTSTGPHPRVTAPSTGCGPFSESRSAVSAGLPGIFTANGVNARIEGDRSGPDAFVHSSARVAEARSTVGNVTIQGAESDCTSNEQGSTGSTRIDRLVIGSRVLTNLSPTPNLEIPVPGLGVVVLNEQVRRDTRASGSQFGSSSVVVTAARLKVSMLGLTQFEVAVAQSNCSITGLNVLR